MYYEPRSSRYMNVVNLVLIDLVATDHGGAESSGPSLYVQSSHLVHLFTPPGDL